MPEQAANALLERGILGLFALTLLLTVIVLWKKLNADSLRHEGQLEDQRKAHIDVMKNAVEFIGEAKGVIAESSRSHQECSRLQQENIKSLECLAVLVRQDAERNAEFHSQIVQHLASNTRPR